MQLTYTFMLLASIPLGRRLRRIGWSLKRKMDRVELKKRLETDREVWIRVKITGIITAHHDSSASSDALIPVDFQKNAN
jgi:hypothetical protein